MIRPQLPLNALRAFEAAARHQSLTRAADELCVSQAALSHQIKALESRLGLILFHRLPRGVALTEEGAALFPVLNESFERMSAVLERVHGGHVCEVISVGVVGTFATGWLLPRLPGFAAAHPQVEVRVLTHNNRLDLSSEGLDLAIRFGDGDWQGLESTPILPAPFAAICAPSLTRVLTHPRDLAVATLLRSYRQDEWSRWFRAAGVAGVTARGPVLDSSLTMASAAAAGAGVALLPLCMFERDIATERLVKLFDTEIDVGRYWLTRLRSRPESDAARIFREWLQSTA